MSETKDVRPVAAELVLRRFYCSGITFEQTLVPAEQSPPRPESGFPLRVEMNFREPSENRLDVRLALRVEPDTEKHQPYTAEVTYVGEFEIGESLRDMDRKMLARSNCSAILLPYVRQTLSDVTSRGTNGSIQVPLLNVFQMLKGSDGEVEAVEASAKESAPKPSSKPRKKRRG